MRYLLIYTPLCLLLALSACELPRLDETTPVLKAAPVPAPVPAEPVVVSVEKEVGIIEALSENGCLITKFSTTEGKKNSSVVAECNHVELLGR